MSVGSRLWGRGGLFPEHWLACFSPTPRSQGQRGEGRGSARPHGTLGASAPEAGTPGDITVAECPVDSATAGSF